MPFDSREVTVTTPPLTRPEEEVTHGGRRWMWVAWCLLFVLIRQGLRGGCDPFLGHRGYMGIHCDPFMVVFPQRGYRTRLAHQQSKNGDKGEGPKHTELLPCP